MAFDITTRTYGPFSSSAALLPFIDGNFKELLSPLFDRVENVEPAINPDSYRHLRFYVTEENGESTSLMVRTWSANLGVHLALGNTKLGHETHNYASNSYPALYALNLGRQWTFTRITTTDENGDPRISYLKEADRMNYLLEIHTPLDELETQEDVRLKVVNDISQD